MRTLNKGVRIFAHLTAKRSALLKRADLKSFAKDPFDNELAPNRINARSVRAEIISLIIPKVHFMRFSMLFVSILFLMDKS